MKQKTTWIPQSISIRCPRSQALLTVALNDLPLSIGNQLSCDVLFFSDEPGIWQLDIRAKSNGAHIQRNGGKCITLTPHYAIGVGPLCIQIHT